MMKNKIITICFLLMPCFLLAQQTNKFVPEYFAVIDTSKAKELLRSCSSSTDPADIRGYWRLSSFELSILQNNFKKIYKFISGNEINKLEETSFQFLGVWKGNRKCIFINAFPSSYRKAKENRNWKTNPVTVCGGGGSFWRALFNVQSREFISLNINAPL